MFAITSVAIGRNPRPILGLVLALSVGGLLGCEGLDDDDADEAPDVAFLTTPET